MKSFHCLFCHGYEDRDPLSSKVLTIDSGEPAIAVHIAQNAAQLTHQVTICTNHHNNVASELNPLVGSLIMSKFNLDAKKKASH